MLNVAAHNVPNNSVGRYSMFDAHGLIYDCCFADLQIRSTCLSIVALQLAKLLCMYTLLDLTLFEPFNSLEKLSYNS